MWARMRIHLAESGRRVRINDLWIAATGPTPPPEGTVCLHTEGIVASAEFVTGAGGQQIAVGDLIGDPPQRPTIRYFPREPLSLNA
jgi:hypothetical protein